MVVGVITAPAERKNNNRTISRISDNKATCPVMNPLTKSYDELEELEPLELLLAESNKSM